MANPYYIPRGPSPFGAAAGTFHKLRGIKEQEEIARGQLDVQRNRNELMGRRIDVDQQVQTERNALLERQVKTQENEQKMKGRAVQPMGPADILPMQTFTAMADKQLGTSIRKTAEPIFNAIKQMQGSRTVDVYRSLKQNWGMYAQPIAEQLEKDHEKAMMSGDIQKAQGIAQMYEAIQSPKFVDSLMPSSAWFDEKERATLAIEARKAAGKASDQFGEPYIDQMGNLVQKNLVTGEIDKISSPTKGMRITTADGTTVETGVTPRVGGDMSKPTRTKIEGKLFDANEQRARLNNIAATYQPEFLELGTKWDVLKTSYGNKLKGTKIGDVAAMIFDIGMKPEDQQRLSDYAAFKANSIKNINMYIKEITGAQMSEAEAKRIRQGMPDPGEGLFGGDDPVTFQRKWMETIKECNLAIARYSWYLQQGFGEDQLKMMAKTDSMMSPKTFVDMVNARGKELKESGMGDAEIMRTLSQEYGGYGG